MRQRLPFFAAALWWGSLSAIGFFAVPMLFAHLGSPAIAGSMAARLFAGQTWIAVGCGLVLLLASRPANGDAPTGVAYGALAFVLGGLLLALLQQYGVSPRIMARENLKLWHGVGSAMYFGQWLCAGVTLWRLQTVQLPPAA
ncbi:DUF4149 domain-containing protein [Xylophilus sp.]|uniref:DUF4149 domain-containing protein n=1 Tax=Xylophilus sp. TaxID=2653893 RepID=UPI002D8011ED|nr:DUF4149 domain-containing protein [Xylophilus sp.]